MCQLMCGCRASPTGTARLQLQHKGDDDHTYTDLANILPCAGILGLPIISWLLDKKVHQLQGPACCCQSCWLTMHRRCTVGPTGGVACACIPQV